MYQNIKDFRSQLTKYGISYPYDIFEICNVAQNIDIQAIPFSTNGLRAMVSLSDKYNPLNCILVNSRLSHEEQNFHGIHELMHILLHNKNDGACFKCYGTVRPEQDSYIEWQANEGAAELLMPYDILLPMVKNSYNKFYDGGDIVSFKWDLSDAFNASQVVVENRLESLKYEINQYINGTPIEGIRILSKRQQDSENIIAESLNDMESRLWSFNPGIVI